MDFSTNYCGPYWSDGEFQSSVVGNEPGVDDLDEACRAHDAAYATSSSLLDLEAADNKFYNDTKELGVKGRIYGSVVLHGNRIARGTMAFMLPFAGLAGYGLLSGFGLNSLLPKKRLRKGKVEPTKTPAQPTGSTPTSDPAPTGAPAAPPIVYDPVVPFEDEGEEDVGGAQNSTPTRYGLYKPLGRKRIRNKLNKNKLEIKKLNKTKQKFQISNPPDNKNLKKKKTTKRKQDAKDQHAQQEALQRGCSHSQLRSGVNYKYCTSCNREFHPGVRSDRASNARRYADRR